MPPCRLPVLFLAVGALALGACATSNSAFGPTAFEQTAYHYQISYAQQATQRLMSGEWRLDNLTSDDTSGVMVQKKGPEYRAMREQDLDQDGVISPNERHEEGIYDLKFVNTHDRGVIWIKAHPFLFNHAAKDLDVLLDNYANVESSVGHFWTGVTFLVERKPIQIGPNLGVSALLETAGTEELKVDPKHRAGKQKVVLTKMVFRNPDGSTDGPEGVQEETVRCGTSLCRQGVALLIIGYANDAEHFDAHVADFDDFVKRVSVPKDGELPSRWRSHPVKILAPEPEAPPPPPSGPSASL